jgi:hypothetical protein
MDIEFHVDDSHNFRGTVFARFASPALARDAMQKLGPFPEYAGQKLRVELQRSNQKSEALMPAEHRGTVQILIECFLASVDHVECWLPASLSPQQRKYAHSLAEKHGLTHVTHSGQDDEKYVYLSKCKSRIPKRASSWSNPYGVSSGESTTIDSPEPQGSLSPPLSASPPGLEVSSASPLTPPGLLSSDAFDIEISLAGMGIERRSVTECMSAWRDNEFETARSRTLPEASEER